MSKENARLLVQQLSVNDYLRSEFEQRRSEGFNAIAAEKGFDCTKEEFKEALNDHHKMLSELAG